jgi:hypothetical protein
MDMFEIAGEESLERQWEYFRDRTGYKDAPVHMLRHLKRAFFAGIAQAVIMSIARTKMTQNASSVFESIQDQLQVFWEQDKIEIEKDAKAKRN